MGEGGIKIRDVSRLRFSVLHELPFLLPLKGYHRRYLS